MEKVDGMQILQKCRSAHPDTEVILITGYATLESAVEAGVKGADVFSWQAIAGPKGMPADVKKKLHAAIVAALNDPENRKRMEDVGFKIVANTPEQMAKFQAQELERRKKVIQVGKIELE